MEYGSLKTSAIFSLVTIVFISYGDGERFFQYRDQRDQGMYTRESGSLAVHNKLEAEVGAYTIEVLEWYLEFLGHWQNN